MRLPPKLPGLLAVLVLLLSEMAFAENAPFAPVTPDASPEAKALLQMLYSISGRHILTGQHNYPAVGSRNSQFAARYIGKTPIVFSSDMGHAAAGNTDSYLARPDIVKEAIRQHQMGAIVTLCWHAIPPTSSEPGTFRPLPGDDPKKLSSVSGQLQDEQFRDLLTPGTPLYQHWCEQVDAVAVYLKQLEEAHVPVLWRPYHEMNGNWFWWGGRTGQYSTVDLYRQIFDRLVRHHHLKNLIWVWSVDRSSKPGMEHDKFFPGIEYVDVLGLDVYGNDFAQSYYDSLVSLSQGKPLALSEVGNPPALEILDKQPLWTYYVTWAGMVRNTTRKTYQTLMADPRVLGLEDTAYASDIAAYRGLCGLPPLSVKPITVDFSGEWFLDEEKSSIGQMTPGFLPSKIQVDQKGNDIVVRSIRVTEYADDDISEDHLTLDGAESKSTFMNSPRVATAKLSADGKTLTIDSATQFVWAPPGSKYRSRDLWTLSDGGQTLTIHRTTDGFRGTMTFTVVYQKR